MRMHCIRERRARFGSLIDTLGLLRSLAALLLLAPPGLAAQERPNIVFVFTDDHAAHAVSAYGSVLNETPDIDRLAAEGVLFRKPCVTNRICAPSRATVLTGQFGHLNSVPTNRETLHPTTLSFPKLLQGAGDKTAVVGKWHLKSRPEGLDHFEVLRGQGPYYNPLPISPDDTVRHTGYTTDIITDRALAWLEADREVDRPFLSLYDHPGYAEIVDELKERLEGPREHYAVHDEDPVPRRR